VKGLIEKPCELCDSPGGDLLWRDGFCRVVLVDDPDYPGFCRVVLEGHVKEMTDLAPPERTRLMNAVFATEAVLRELLRPDKVNLASLGNVTQHLHWHVVPRREDDRHFPRPIWAEPSRARAARRAAPDRDALGLALKRRLD
jgi:diadenosine tetraphosphate (Ap4A) HIT family hydrolase